MDLVYTHITIEGWFRRHASNKALIKEARSTGLGVLVERVDEHING